MASNALWPIACRSGPKAVTQVPRESTPAPCQARPDSCSTHPRCGGRAEGKKHREKERNAGRKRESSANKAQVKWEEKTKQF